MRSWLGRSDERGSGGAEAVSSLVAASLGRRLLAVLIDLVATLVGLVTGGLGVVALTKTGALAWFWRSRPVRCVRRRVGRHRALDDPLIARRTLESTRGQLALVVFGLTTAVWSRNVRGPGYRVLRLRRVDALTGGPVGVRAAIVRNLVEQLRSALIARICAPITRRGQARGRAAATEMRRLVREHTGDPEGLRTAMRERRIRPWTSCLAALPKLLAAYATQVATLSGRERRSLADKLAGTIVIVEK